jgi:hypothetical protein
MKTQYLAMFAVICILAFGVLTYAKAEAVKYKAAKDGKVVMITTLSQKRLLQRKEVLLNNDKIWARDKERCEKAMLVIAEEVKEIDKLLKDEDKKGGK